MIVFSWPWVLALLPLPWLVRRWAPPVPYPSGRAMKMPNFEDIMALGAGHMIPSSRQGSSKWFWLGIIIWLALLVAADRKSVV